VGGMFCDLQKAFDCVNHDILLQKLKYYGITDVAFKLFKSYLSNRYQRTVIKANNLNKSFSSWKIIKCGVPQGSVLGPLLFLIYINDLPVSISKTAKSILLADDTSITVTNENKTEFRHTLQLAMIETSNWFQSNRLTLNYEKTHLLHFVTKKQAEIQQQIVISNTLIKNISSTRFLGLIIDNTLSWKDHITEITPKLNKASYIVRTLIFLRSPKY